LGGAAGSAIQGVALGTWEASEFFFSNSALDSIRRGSNAEQAGTGVGNANGGNFMVGNAGAFAFPANIEVLHVVILKGASASAMPASWRASITAKYGASVNV